MSGVSLPVTRPVGRALLVGSPGSRAEPLATLQGLGYGCTEADSPYAAMAELCRGPMAYRALILSLAGIYREELELIRAAKQRFPTLEVWLAHTDGRQALLADAMCFGADGLLADDGLHRIAVADPPIPKTASQTAMPVDSGGESGADSDAIASGEPVLTVDELRALLQEQPASPPPADTD